VILDQSGGYDPAADQRNERVRHAAADAYICIDVALSSMDFTKYPTVERCLKAARKGLKNALNVSSRPQKRGV
jgi:hypothetical protein